MTSSLPDKIYRIGIDARKLQDFGIGTYVRNLIRALADLDTGSLALRYLLLVRPEDREQLADLSANFELTVESSPVYSLREFVTLSWQLWRQRLDLYHATHYVLPAALTPRVVVTIHDIIHLLYPEFLPSRMAFLYARRMIHRSLTRGDRIIAVSQNTRADLMQQFAMDGRKIEVIYNGVEDVFRRRLPDEEIERWLRSLGIARPYLLFVGNPKPHKNLDTVVQAYARARRLAPFDAPLVCVGNRSGS
ncbi:MAG TPA: glycosyltransferase, partial [Thermoanaerobaculia bacterium]|nr:glycosyltransferase [Thermoanaerobaculia bacterium]